MFFLQLGGAAHQVWQVNPPFKALFHDGHSIIFTLLHIILEKMKFHKWYWKNYLGILVAVWLSVYNGKCRLCIRGLSLTSGLTSDSQWPSRVTLYPSCNQPQNNNHHLLENCGTTKRGTRGFNENWHDIQTTFYPQQEPPIRWRVLRKKQWQKVPGLAPNSLFFCFLFVKNH